MVAGRDSGDPFAPITLRLGGLDKTLEALPARANREWKALLIERLQSRLGTMGRLDDWSSVVALVGDLTDLQVELLLAYDRDGRLGGEDWILDHATDREIYEAFKAVCIEAFPFLADARAFPRLSAELLGQAQARSGSSASASGGGADPS